jgi:hypothetical protein
MEIAEFLLARIAEDEAAAREGQVAKLPFWVGQIMGRSGSESAPRYVNRFNPARVLAECEAKRRIVEELGDFGDGHVWASGEASRAETALQALASVYADHPDFDPEWKP